MKNRRKCIVPQKKFSLFEHLVQKNTPILLEEDTEKSKKIYRLDLLKVVLASRVVVNLSHLRVEIFSWLTSVHVKVTFLLFCCCFEKIVSEYLHVTSQKNVLNLETEDIFFTGNFHFCNGKLIRAHKSLC